MQRIYYYKIKMITAKNLHLIVSVLIVIPIAVIYGFCPNLVFNVNIDTIDEHSIFKASMGLYLAFSLLWIVGIFDRTYWIAATIANILFMIGMGVGRITSMISDGIPSTIFILGTLGELVLGFYGWYQLIRQKSVE
jgi:hypothetical protein